MLRECFERELVFFFLSLGLQYHFQNLFLFNYMIVKINTHNNLNSRVRIYFFSQNSFIYLFTFLYATMNFFN